MEFSLTMLRMLTTIDEGVYYDLGGNWLYPSTPSDTSLQYQYHNTIYSIYCKKSVSLKCKVLTNIFLYAIHLKAFFIDPDKSLSFFPVSRWYAWQLSKGVPDIQWISKRGSIYGLKRCLCIPSKADSIQLSVIPPDMFLLVECYFYTCA